MSSIIRATTSSGLQVAPDNSGSLQLQTNGTTTAVTIDTSQNVGIGTTSPSVKLHLKAGTSTYVNFAQENTNGGNDAKIVDWINNGNDYTLRLVNDAYSSANSAYTVNRSGFTVNSHAWYTGSGTERMLIDSAGNVGIGTSSPTFKLVAANSTTDGTWLYSSGTVSILGLGGYGTASENGVSWRYDRSSGNTTFNTGTRDTQTERLRITSTGTLTSQATYDNTAAGSTVVVTSAGLIRRTSSSLKYKKDVETLEQTIVDNAINNLRPVWYRTKNAEGDDKETWSHIGLIAEEVDLVEPRLVKYKTVEVTQDENGANVTTELETPVPEDVDYAKLSVILLAKVKQLEARIAVLEAK